MENVQLYYAIGPFCYGIGKTIEQAIKRARTCWPTHLVRLSGPIRKKYFSVWATDAPKIYVSEIDGSISVDAPYKLEKIQTSTMAEKR